MYAVSSTFQVTAELTNAPWSRRFYIGSSDYSSRVTKWPSVNKRWDELRPQQVTIELSNEDRTFNFLAVDPTKLRNTCSIELGFSYVGSEEYVTLFAGTMDAVKYQGGGCSITMLDKFNILSDRKVGDHTSPVGYTSSNYLVHDMAWYACTSLGGLSAITSTSNPDIDYTSFSSWTSVFSTDNVRVQAHLTGQHPIEILRALAKMTQSAIYTENNKIKFTRFSILNSEYVTLNADGIMDVTATLDDRELVNKAWVSGDYNVDSNAFGFTLYDQSSDSQVSYGLRESLVDETLVWFVDSASALNLAQRTILARSELNSRFNVRSALHAMRATLGDPVFFQDALLEVSDTFRIVAETVDIDTGQKTFDIDQTRYSYGAFILDVSTLDSTDILT